MRIGITCYPTYGGSGIVATELGLELALRGHEIHFITYANPIRLDPSIPRIHYHEVEVSSYPLFQYPPYCLALASRMADVATTYNLDLLHVHYAIPHSISAMLARQMVQARRPLPFITTLHGTDITLVGADPSYFAITKFSIEQSDAVTTISEDLRRQTADVFGISSPMRVIHNFVNTTTYAPDPQKQPGKLLIHLSNFRPVKRPSDCIRILAEVRKHEDARLQMVGDGPERGPAEHLAHQLGVHPYVDFLGKRNNVEQLIRKADILLMPSDMESFGLAALEAMACGVPAIGTKVGGVPELITSNVDGYLEQPGDILAQANRAADLLTNPALHQQFAKAARHAAETRFSTDRIIPMYEHCYEHVLRQETP